MNNLNYSATKTKFTNEDELLAHLGALEFSPEDRVGLVAGHFMLMYDDQADALVPMLYQDTANPRVAELSRKMAGDFPLRTFQLGVEIQQAYAARSIPSQLTLIVNDHIFQTPGWASQNLCSKQTAGELRHDYYRQKHPLPTAFFRTLQSKGLTSEVILDNHRAGRTPADILPKNTRLFSETALRNHFDQNTRLELRQLPIFSEVRENNGKSRLMFVGDNAIPAICLTEDGECGCSGELIEYFIRLAARKLNRLIFFVPDECQLPANAGIQAFLHTPEQYRGTVSSIHVVSGMGGMGESTLKNKPIYVTAHAIA